LDLTPWEVPESRFYGATLAAIATSTTDSEYRSRPAIRENIRALRNYLNENQAAQPLHNRLMYDWALRALKDDSAEPARRAVIEQVTRIQSPDGGWTLASIGPWKDRADAPATKETDAYATALTAFVLQQAGVAQSNPSLARALAWLGSHQDRDHGYWSAASMNKRYPADSMMVHFMRDAATAYASAALSK
jgi:squalene-hopene/tetraprenyl-beta-curcumene cyclase